MSRGALVLGLVGAGLVVGSLALAGGARASEPTPAELPMGYDRIRELAAKVQRATGPWPGLADFLVAVAFWESSDRAGGPPNAAACHGACGSNSAGGLYQIRPKTADVDAVTAEPSLLFDPEVSTAVAAWLIYRLATRWTTYPVDWMAIRRGWRYPYLVRDREEADPESPGVRERFIKSLDAVGAPRALMQQRALPPGFNWPGFDAVLASVRSP